MNNSFIYTNIVRITLLLLVQIFLLNVLPFGIFYIMIYPLGILLLPIQMKRVWVVVLAFVCGAILDWFGNGGGLHTASLTFLGYFRGYILNYYRPKSGWDKFDVPNIYKQGITWFTYYISIGLIAHHFVYFSLESFSSIHILFTIRKMLLSMIMSFIVIMLINLLFLRNNKL